MVSIIENKNTLPFLPVALPKTDIKAPISVDYGTQSASLPVYVLPLVCGSLILIKYGAIKLFSRFRCQFFYLLDFLL